MNLVWMISLTGLAVATVGLLVLVAKLLSYRRSLAGGASGEFSMERYEPMLRLLSDEDLQFLASQPGMLESGGVEEWKRDRRRIFRMYLRELTCDFQAMHADARQLLAAAPEQHADWVGILLRQQVSFWMALAAVEFQLAMDRLGFGSVDPRRLVDLARTLRSMIERSSPATGPIAV